MLKHPQTDKALHTASFLSPRDRRICLDLYDHKVLTTHHLIDLYFDSQRVAERRLLKLYQHGVVQRFRPRLEKGSAPHHFLLGDLGAHVVAAELGVQIKDLKLAKDRLLRLAYSPRLGHLVALNTFFSKLIRGCRHTDHVRVTHWWGEDRVRRRWGQFVLPDGLGRIEAAGREQTFFLELDQGTESPSKLARKLNGYNEASRLPEAPRLLLFSFPDHLREASARRALKPCGLTIASATVERHSQDPLGPNWLPWGTGRRLPLLELPTR